MTQKVTKRQQAVLDCIEACIREKGYGPTVREVCQSLGLSSPSTVHVHLKALEDKGFIKRDPLKSRSIALTYPIEEVPSPVTAFAAAYSKLVNVPLVGNVAAGSPILAEENITDTITLPTDIVGDAPSFMLSVRGESMIEAGINDGDYVVVKEQPVANNGDIVVAIIDDGATVKRFFREADHIRLQPENSTMDPIITTDCSIAGKVVAVELDRALLPVLAETIWDRFSSIMQDIYGQVVAISTIVAVTVAAIALIVRMVSRNQRAVDEATSWLKRIVVTWIVLNTLGFIVAYLQPLIAGGQYTGG